MKLPTIIAAILSAVFAFMSVAHNVAWAFAALLTIKLWAAFAIGYFVAAFITTFVVFVRSR